MREALITGLSIIIAMFIALFIATAIFAAENKSLDQLLTERSGVKSALSALEKQFQANQVEFDKTDAAAKHIAKQNELRKAHTDASTKLKDLDAAIVEKVTAEKTKK